jgi:hypothetical protein
MESNIKLGGEMMKVSVDAEKIREMILAVYPLYYKLDHPVQRMIIRNYTGDYVKMHKYMAEVEGR